MKPGWPQRRGAPNGPFPAHGAAGQIEQVIDGAALKARWKFRLDRAALCVPGRIGNQGPTVPLGEWYAILASALATTTTSIPVFLRLGDFFPDLPAGPGAPGRRRATSRPSGYGTNGSLGTRVPARTLTFKHTPTIRRTPGPDHPFGSSQTVRRAQKRSICKKPAAPRRPSPARSRGFASRESNFGRRAKPFTIPLCTHEGEKVFSSLPRAFPATFAGPPLFWDEAPTR